MTAPRPDRLLGDEHPTVQAPQMGRPQTRQAPYASNYPQQEATARNSGYGTAAPSYPPIAGAQNTAGQWYANPDPRMPPSTGYPVSGAAPMAPSYPSTGYPTSYQTAQSPKRRNWLFALGAAVLILAIAVSVVIKVELSSSAESTASSQSSEAAPTSADTHQDAPPVPSSALQDLLLSKREVADIVGATSMVGSAKSGGEIYKVMGKTKYVDADCIILMPTELANYGGSGYTGTRSQFLDSPSLDRRTQQAVVSFPDAQSATNYVTKAKEKIGKCSNRSANFRRTTETEDDWWTVGEPQDVDGVTVVPQTQEGHEGWTCQSGLTARNNVVVDLYACGRDLPDNVASTFANAIADNVGKQ